ncbi:MAG: serine/threonine-protein kinase PknK [Hormoscilla sp. GUM202]|nr:serine/threonine-protein kinase PknK [Hormoscilla sp. GUM202]
MIELPGYQITSFLIFGVRTSIYRGIRELDQKPIIVKALNSDYPTLEEIARLRQEYIILENVACPGIIKPYGLEKYENGYALILEDIGGKSLSRVVRRKYSLTKYLQIAIAIADTLEELHKMPIIHKDIKPSNIIIDEGTGEVRLTDFSIASRLAFTNATPGQVGEGDRNLKGTLAYMSPEQTGRMNRSIDYRTDFYSLGVTLYEMLTGRLPFISSDPMELVHCHIAKQPVWPQQVNPEIPEAVAAIVMKLLAKRAEERYQSGAGLKYDLKICLERLLAGGSLSDFVPGSRDRPSQLLISQKLYGREEEVRALMKAFAWVSQEGEAEMLLVSGYSGIGKTAIVNEVQRPIVKARGYFITGKYDQFKRNIPYSGVIQAFSELISMLLTESSQRLAAWRTELGKALGPNGRVIVDVIPEVQLIIGPQPEVPQLGPSEGQNRFNRVFLQFIGVFCKAEHPLVLFLDDLQWADAASLQLIELLMTDRDSKYILTIGAYRDNEVSPTHPLIQAIERMQSTSAVVNDIVIGPLSNGDVSKLVADTLFGQHGSDGDKGSAVASNEKIEALADLIFHKTGGNPFFLTQMLKSLYAENLLVYEVETDSWQWDMAKIQAVGITDYSVVELMARNIQKLPAATQQVLKLAACIGNKFNLQVLAIANGSSTTTAAGQLWAALQAGLLLPLSEGYKILQVFGGEEEEDRRVADVKVDYKFLHDRVQQAVYSLIPEEEKKDTHLRIGQQLLENTSPEARQERIFALVNQLNHGVDLLSTLSEKDDLAEMNLIASHKAKAAAAYEASLKYINVGLGLLEEDGWQRNYDLMQALYLEAVEAEYLNSNFERSQVLAEVALEQAKTLLEKVKVYELLIQADIAQNQMQAALELGQQVLEMLGVTLDKAPPEIGMIEELEYLPEITDADKIAAMRILYNMSNAAFVADPTLYSKIIFTCVNICRKYGNGPLAELVYIDYANIISAFMGYLDAGYRFGKLALRLLDKFDAKEHKSIVLDIFNGHIIHWKEHVRKTIEPLQEAVQSGLESGELVYSGYAAINYCTNRFYIGDHLEDVEQKLVQYADLLKKLKLEYHVLGMKIYQQMMLNLLAKSMSAFELTGAAFKETEMQPVFQDDNNLTSLFVVDMAKLILLYLFKQPGEAVENAKLAEEYISAVPGLLVVAQHNFYYSLALLAQHPHWEEREQKQALTKVASLQKQMQHWAEQAPCNFQHKYDLVAAERARVKGEHIVAIELYEQAIAGASEQGYTHEEALAKELAGEFHLGRGCESMGKFYIIESYYGYIRWGAKAKVKDLESKYPQFLSSIATAKPQKIDVTRTRAATSSAALLDLPALLEAGLAISNEMVLERLIEKLMQIAIENAGAEKGVLILNQDSKLVVAASGEVEGDKIIVNQSDIADMSQALPID